MLEAIVDNIADYLKKVGYLSVVRGRSYDFEVLSY